MYLGEDSWDKNVDFKLDAAKYPDPAAMVTNLTASKQRLVAYLDAGINVNNRGGNPAYTAGDKVQGFVKSSINADNIGGYLVNSKQSKNVVYVDWLNSDASKFWTTQVSQYQKNVPFDGLWTTMNEPFGDVAGEIQSKP